MIAFLTLIAFLPNVLNLFINMNTNKKFKEELKIFIFRNKKATNKTSISEVSERENEYIFTMNRKKLTIPTITITSIRRHSLNVISQLQLPDSFRRRSIKFIPSFNSIDENES